MTIMKPEAEANDIFAAINAAFINARIVHGHGDLSISPASERSYRSLVGPAASLPPADVCLKKEATEILHPLIATFFKERGFSSERQQTQRQIEQNLLPSCNLALVHQFFFNKLIS